MTKAVRLRITEGGPFGDTGGSALTRVTEGDTFGTAFAPAAKGKEGKPS